MNKVQSPILEMSIKTILKNKEIVSATTYPGKGPCGLLALELMVKPVNSDEEPTRITIAVYDGTLYVYKEEER